MCDNRQLRVQELFDPASSIPSTEDDERGSSIAHPLGSHLLNPDQLLWRHFSFSLFCYRIDFPPTRHMFSCQVFGGALRHS